MTTISAGLEVASDQENAMYDDLTKQLAAAPDDQGTAIATKFMQTEMAKCTNSSADKIPAYVTMIQTPPMVLNDKNSGVYAGSVDWCVKFILHYCSGNYEDLDN